MINHICYMLLSFSSVTYMSLTFSLNRRQQLQELTCSLLKIHCFLLRWYRPTPPSLNSDRTQTLGIMMPFLSLERSIIWFCLSLLGHAALRALVVQRTWKPVSFRTIFSIGVGLDTVQTLSIPFSESEGGNIVCTDIRKILLG